MIRRITDLTPIATNEIADSDLIEIVDRNDDTMSETGTNKSVTTQDLANYLSKIISEDVTIAVNSNNNAVHITQGGGGNALLVSDEDGDSSPFVITSAGDVGIGTQLPTTKLHVAGNVAINGNISILKSDGTVKASITSPEENSIAFSTALTERIRIDASGNVGIGTTNTSAKLGVVANSGGSSLTLTDNVNSTLTVKHESPLNLLTYQGYGTTTQRWTSLANDSATPVEHMRITSTGNVGIGTKTPQVKLSITGTSGTNISTEGIFQITTGTGANTDDKLQFGVVDSNYSWIQAAKPGTTFRNLILNGLGGNVGIGTTNQTASRLEINSSATSIATQISSPLTPSSLITYGDAMLISMCGADTSFRAFTIGGTVSSPTAVLNDSIVGSIRGFGYNGNTSGTASAFNGYGTGGIAAINFFAKGNQTSSNSGSYMTFVTSAENTINTPVERMRISDSGNVGIGTGDPKTKLHVEGGRITIRGNSPTIQLIDTSSGNYAGDNSNKNAYLHNDNGRFYILAGSDDTATQDWDRTGLPNGRFPFEINLDTNDSAFGGNINSISYTAVGNGSKFDSTIFVNESTHATSNRASISIGGWVLGQDASGNGERSNFFFWDNNFGNGQFRGGFCGTGSFMPNDNFYIVNTTNTNQYWYYNKQNGTGTVSDRRTKRDISTIDTDKALSFITSITPSTFRVASDLPIQAGFIAQDILSNAKTEDQKEIINNHNTYDENDPDCPILGVSDRPIVAYLVAAMQEQQKIIDSLQSRLEALENKTA